MTLAEEYAKACDEVRARRISPDEFAKRMTEQSGRRIAMLVGALVAGAMEAAIEGVIDDHDPGDEDRS